MNNYVLTSGQIHSLLRMVDAAGLALIDFAKDGLGLSSFDPAARSCSLWRLRFSRSWLSWVAAATATPR